LFGLRKKLQNSRLKKVNSNQFEKFYITFIRPRLNSGVTTKEEDVMPGLTRHLSK